MKNKILNDLNSAINYFMYQPGNTPGTKFSSNVDLLIDIKSSLSEDKEGPRAPSHVEYFEKEIQSKLEQLPRAIAGNAPRDELDRICIELQILRDAKDHFYSREK